MVYLAVIAARKRNKGHTPLSAHVLATAVLPVIHFTWSFGFAAGIIRSIRLALRFDDGGAI